MIWKVTRELLPTVLRRAFLEEYVENNGHWGDCEYCGAEDEYVIEAAEEVDQED